MSADAGAPPPTASAASAGSAASAAPAASSASSASAAPEGARASSAPARSGRLVRRLVVLFLAFVLVAIAVSCALVYGTTRSTYQDSQSERLLQISQYVASTIRTTGALDDAAMDSDAWMALGDEVDVDGTSADWYARSYDVTDRLEELQAEASDAAAQQGIGSDAYAQAQQRVDEAQREMDRIDATYYWHSLTDMVDRMKAMFSLTSLRLYRADAAACQIAFITEGVDEGQVRTQTGAHAPGDVEERPAADYPALWQAVSSGEPSPSVSTSPDGSLYLFYLPIDAPDGHRWICEAGISTSDFEAMVLRQMLQTLMVMGSLFTVLLVCLLVLLRRTIARPLARLAGFVRSYAQGKSPETAHDIRGSGWPNDEIGVLADSTADMIDELHGHIGRIAALSTERERVRSELEIAGRIQVSALPEVRPPFTGQGEFDLSASMRPAKAVGGDFYDFFLIDESCVGVVVADVSDKGVPAALFMMRAKALIKQLLSEGLAPQEAMRRANDDLCRDNNEGMFVTVWLGVLDLSSGELAYACGGHNPPLYRHADGQVEWMRDRSGLILGCFEGVAYRGFARRMEPGDAVLLYTDGVTEAMNAQGECYGEDRLEALIGSLDAGIAPDELTKQVEQGVAAFASGADQADDITLLALRFDGPRHGVSAAGVEPEGAAGSTGSSDGPPAQASDGPAGAADAAGSRD